MAGLDDAGMHRPDRDLVQALAFDREEDERRGPRRLFGVRPERLHHVPGAENRATGADPKARRLEPVEIADRPLEPDRRRMHARRPKESARRRHRRLTTAPSPAFSSNSAMCTAPCSRPEAEQRPAAGGEIARNAASRRLHPRSRAATAHARRLLLRCGMRVDQAAMRYPRTLATFWNQTTSGGGR